MEHVCDRSFEQALLRYPDAAYNLAHWLTGNERAAQNVTQHGCVRAFRFFSVFRDGDARSWLLTIVRHTASTWLQRDRQCEAALEFDLSTELGGGRP